MPSHPDRAWRFDPVRPACAPFDVSTLERRRRDYLGRLRDLYDVIGWPVLTTLASLLPARLSRLIRDDGNPHTEADPIG
jgi:hypothetical protein